MCIAFAYADTDANFRISLTDPFDQEASTVQSAIPSLLDRGSVTLWSATYTYTKGTSPGNINVFKVAHMPLTQLSGVNHQPQTLINI